MEPISVILAALAAGAVAAAKDTAGTAVKDAYEGLKALIKKKFAEKGKTDDSDIVDKHEKKPDSEGVKTLLKEELLEAKIDRDAEVIKTAEELLKQLKPEEFAAGKYNINVGDDIKGMVGDGTFKGIAGDISGGNISQKIN
jgi:disulfide oxidoreductase YuzD